MARAWLVGGVRDGFRQAATPQGVVSQLIGLALGVVVPAMVNQIADVPLALLIPMGLAVALLTAAVLIARQERHRQASRPTGAVRPTPTPPKEQTSKWVALAPLIIGDQMKATLRHESWRPITDHETHLWAAEAEIDGPAGTYPQRGQGRYLNGVYSVHYPRDFNAPPLSPGRYVISWFGRGPTGRVDAGGRIVLSDRQLLAECEVEVDGDSVRTARRADPATERLVEGVATQLAASQTLSTLRQVVADGYTLQASLLGDAANSPVMQGQVRRWNDRARKALGDKHRLEFDLVTASTPYPENHPRMVEAQRNFLQGVVDALHHEHGL